MATFLFYAFNAKEVCLSDLRRSGISEEANLTDKCGKSIARGRLGESEFSTFCFLQFLSTTI